MNERPSTKGNKKAAALKYNSAKDAAPKILASGKGLLAEKILELAREQNIAVYKNPHLVEALVQLDVGREIPPELYSAVAEIMAFIYSVDVASFTDNNSDD